MQIRGGGLGVGCQPGGGVVGALEIEQGHSCGEGCAYGQGFQLFQWLGLDAGGSDFAQGATAAGELAES